MRAFVRVRLAVAVVLVLAACVGPSRQRKKSVAELMAAGDYASAAAAIHAARDEYGTSNRVLYHLDLAMALHLAGRYADSNTYFTAAENRMEELYTRSVSRMAGSLMANENVEEYRGTAFDRVLAHVFHALNFVQLGRLDEALVEVRRVEAFLDERGRSAREGSVAYRDDAFARYLAALVYEEGGKSDDARISYEAAIRAYRDYERVFQIRPPGFPFPADLGADGEIVFIHYAGPAPRKKSVTSSDVPAVAASTGPAAARHGGFLGQTLDRSVSAAKAAASATGAALSGAAGAVLGAAHPEYEPASFRVRRSRIEVGPAVAETAAVEDIDAIARQELAERLAALKTRSAARAAVKLLGTVTGVDATGSEFSDVRGWQTIPSQIRLARVRLPAGEHSLTVRYLDETGSVVASGGRSVRVNAGRRTWIIERTAD
ncbi:MAG: hypothetical protein AAB036_06490 [Elusimicrobiota bacterium]